MNARKTRYVRDDLAALLGDAGRIVASRGKNFVEVDPADADLLAKKVLGPSGTLRAPAARVGKTWLVGFSEAAWSEVFG